MRMGMDGSTDLDSVSGEIPMIKISHRERAKIVDNGIYITFVE